MKLSKRFALVCQAYADALNELWETDGEWIGKDRYEVFDVADCFINLNDVRLLVDKKVPFDVFYEWYDYDRQVHYGIELKEPTARIINLDHWLMGFPEEHKVSAEIRQYWENRYFERI